MTHSLLTSHGICICICSFNSNLIKLQGNPHFASSWQLMANLNLITKLITLIPYHSIKLYKPLICRTYVQCLSLLHTLTRCTIINTFSTELINNLIDLTKAIVSCRSTGIIYSEYLTRSLKLLCYVVRYIMLRISDRPTT